MAKTSQAKPTRPSRRGLAAPREMVKHPVIDNRRYPTTEEVGKLLNVPPERIREIKEFAAKIFDKKENSETTR